MAAKSHVDVSVSERRLRPIYDWLDVGNNKKALQEAEKVLKKQPSFQCAKVLKSLALLRLGKEDECEQILESVRQEVPCEDSTLQAMTLCYREIHKPEKICEIYEGATKKDPSNEELLTHLFMAYVRVNDYRKQQQTAMALYKLKPKNPYYFWAVMSLVMQAYKADEKVSKDVVLLLAERMVKKFVEEGKVDAEQEVQLYLMILEMQKKYAEALEVLSGPLGAKLMSCPNPVPVRRAGLLMKMERWSDTNLSYKLLLREDIDRWSFYQDYFTSSFHLFDEKPSQKSDAAKQGPIGDSNANVLNVADNVNVDSENAQVEKSEGTLGKSVECISSVKDETKGSDFEVVQGGGEAVSLVKCDGDLKEDGMWSKADTTPEDIRHFLAILSQKNEKLSRKFRGPYLAYLELYQRLLDRGKENPNEIAGDIVELLLSYLRNFGDKPCCFPDLKIFLNLLPENRKGEFIAKVEDMVSLRKGEFPETAQQMQQHINLIELSRRIGFHQSLSREEKLELATNFICHYAHGICFASPLQTDFSMNDMYAMIACHLLYEAWIDEKMSGIPPTSITKAMIILELVLSLSPSNYHAKLLLLKCYSLVGAGAGAHCVYELLDVKHMQLDSLGHLHCSHLYGNGLYSYAASIYETTLKFFTANYKDSVDHLTFSYKFGSFLTIEEFVEFRERLDNSLHYSSITVEDMLLVILHANNHTQRLQAMSLMDINPDKDKVEWAKLQDNRDLKVMISWDPPDRQMSPETTKETFEMGVDLLRLRSLILRILGAAIMLSENAPALGKMSKVDVTNGSESSNDGDLTSVLQRLMNELDHHFGSLCSRYPIDVHVKKSLLNVIAAPLPSRLFSLIRHGSWCKHLQVLVKILIGVSLSRDDQKQLCSDASQENDGSQLLNNMSHAADMLECSVKELKEGVSKCRESLDLSDRKSFLENAVIVVEMIGMTILVCGVCHSILKPMKNAPLVKKGKKKKESISAQQPKILELYNTMVNRLKQSMEDMRKALEVWGQDLSSPSSVVASSVKENSKFDSSLSALLKDPRINNCNAEVERKSVDGLWDASELKVLQRLLDSYLASSREIRQLLTKKLKNIESLHV
ncbi:N-alpha-acetyltransferase 25, NatB auxiliary subunit [Ischnura elegans]|uniref:N-alpha-acetyltransferase 25, NatB auxiliary subunit n=1 Tax=Ischnura elegans TaxID=197161 RepID=UPI001ED8BDB6|nr:N-alpha-acetyltransferase 25, NatB auxiliary subunit [Ischnura elegans]